MAKEAKNNNKGIIVGICCAVVVAIAVIIAVVVANNNSLNDSYFVSDGTKYVLTLEEDEIASDDGEYAPEKMHMVYTYDGDTITGLKSYYVYADAATAQKAFNALKDSGENMSKYELNGKYIIETASEEDYKDITVSDVKQQIEFMEMLRNMNLDDSEDEEAVDETESTEEVTEGTEGEVVEEATTEDDIE